jgi:hypothetical protein
LSYFSPVWYYTSLQQTRFAYGCLSQNLKSQSECSAAPLGLSINDIFIEIGCPSLWCTVYRPWYLQVRSGQLISNSQLICLTSVMSVVMSSQGGLMLINLTEKY